MTKDIDIGRISLKKFTQDSLYALGHFYTRETALHALQMFAKVRPRRVIRL